MAERPNAVWLADLIARGNPLLIDGERFLDRLWPNILPERFEDLRLPFLTVATDYFGRTEAVFHAGPLLPAVAGSMAIPGLVKPVWHGGRLLVDGGAVNPLPFDHLIGRASLLVAVDVTGGPSPRPARAPAGGPLSRARFLAGPRHLGCRRTGEGGAQARD